MFKIKKAFEVFFPKYIKMHAVTKIQVNFEDQNGLKVH